MPLFPVCHLSVPTSQLLCALVLVSREAFEGLLLGSGATYWYRELDMPEASLPASAAFSQGPSCTGLRSPNSLAPKDRTAFLLPYHPSTLPYWILLGYFLNRVIFFLLLFFEFISLLKLFSSPLIFCVNKLIKNCIEFISQLMDVEFCSI